MADSRFLPTDSIFWVILQFLTPKSQFSHYFLQFDQIFLYEAQFEP